MQRAYTYKPANITASLTVFQSRTRGLMRRHWQAQAFRAINSARKQLRAARVILAVAMADPALASDQVAA